MKQDGIVTATSLLTVFLVTLHMAGDIAYGMEPGNLTDLSIVALVLAVWLYGTLVLTGKRSGYVVLLLASLLGFLMSAVHMKGAGLAGSSHAAGNFWFAWILLALGSSAAFLLLLSVRGLWRLRDAGKARRERPA